jgi:hypothetical protein
MKKIFMRDVDRMIRKYTKRSPDFQKKFELAELRAGFIDKELVI